MATVLLIDINEMHGANITVELARRKHCIANALHEDIRGDLAGILTGVDVVVVNVTPAHGWDILAAVCREAARSNIGPCVLAVSSVHSDPAAKLRAEKLGARFVYL